MGARVALRAEAEVDPGAGVTPTAGLGAGPTPTLPTLGAEVEVGATATVGPGAGAGPTHTPLTRQDPDHEQGPGLPQSRDAAGHRASSTKEGLQGERPNYIHFRLDFDIFPH